MKKTFWRRQAEAYPVRGELAPRFTDLDLWQHLNNAAIIALHGEACQRWLRGVLGAQVWRSKAPLLAARSLATDFLAEAHYPEPLATGVRLLGVDAQGFRLGSALFQHGACVGLHEVHIGAWQHGLPVPLPADVADALRAEAARQPAVAGEPGAADASQPALAAAPALSLGDGPWQLAMDSRFGDTDALGLAGDLSLARCAEQTRVQFLTQAFGPGRLGGPTGFIVGHVALQWLQRGRPPARWVNTCGVSRLGERSMAVRGGVFEGERCLAVCDTVMVAIDHASRRSCPLSDEARAALAPYALRT